GPSRLTARPPPTDIRAVPPAGLAPREDLAPPGGNMRMMRAAWPPFLLVFTLAATAAAQQKPTLEPADYAKWESIGSGELSPDGRWIAYTIRRVDADGELRFHDVRADSEHVVAYATNP